MPGEKVTRKCRTCLRNSTITFALNDSAKGCMPKHTYGQLLQEYAKLEYSSQYENLMPQHLCANCSWDLRNAYIFIRKAQYCNTKLINVIAKQLPSLQENETVVPPHGDNNKLESDLDVKSEQDMEFNHTNITENQFEIVKFSTSTDNDLMLKSPMTSNINISSSNIYNTTEEPRVSETQIDCPICNKTITKGESLITHVHILHDIEEEPYLQNTEFPIIKGNCNEKQDEKNKKTIVSDRNKLKCLFCSHMSTKKLSLLRHIQKSHKTLIGNLKTEQRENNATQNKNNSRKVEESDEMFIRNMLNFKKRQVYNVPSKSSPINCDKCGKVYKNFRAFRAHQEAVHISKDKYSVCPHCGKKFKLKFTLQVHIKNAHTPKAEADIEKSAKAKEKRFLCAQCSYVCRNLTALDIHMKRNHTGEQPHKCDICSKTFVVKFDLKTHRYLHTGERPYKCTFCPKSFRNSSQLLKHKRIHSNERPYKCQDCGKSFTQSYNLTLHKRTHLRQKNLNCIVCNKFFDNRSLLNMHRINENHCDEVI